MSAMFITISLLLFYHYVFYPLTLAVLAYFFPKPHAVDESFEPEVSLVISARNEEKVIRQKLENSLALEYPKEKLTIWVVSDGSSDATDSIVKEYADRGIRLFRPAVRRGKTAGLNKVMDSISSEFVVFSDANAIYDPLAIRKLVRHFHDPEVGYVVGYARYEEANETEAGFSEGAYWNYEILLKRWSSRVGSVVGGDGAIYAIRNDLYEPLLDTDINDFVNPLQIIAKGYRGLFDPEAFCLEKPAGKFDLEFKRKIRITNRSFSGLIRVPQVCNPFRVGLFSWQVFSHKVLRWFSPYLFLGQFLFSLCLPFSTPWGPVGNIVVSAYAIIAIGGLLWLLFRQKRGTITKLLGVSYYFVLVHLACALGVWKRLFGETIATWETPRENIEDHKERFLFEDQIVLAILLGIVLLSSVRLFLFFLGSLNFSAILAILLIVLLIYAYLGYPLVLKFISGCFQVHVHQDENYTPEVTLLIAAYNEEKVIEEKILNSLDLNYPKDRLRIVIASDGSTDATNSIVEKYLSKGVELLAYPTNRGKISVLNDTVSKLSSEIVVFSDANVMYDPRSVQFLVRNFADERVGGVSGKVVLLNDKLSYGKAEEHYYGIEHLIQEHEGVTGALVGADGAMYAIRRKLFEPLPPDTILDDFVISMNVARRGLWFLHESKALGFERNELEIAGEFKRKTRIIAGGYQCMRKGLGMPFPSNPFLLFKFFSHKFLRWTGGPLFALLLLDLFYLELHVSNNIWLSLVLLVVTLSILAAILAQLFPTVRRLPGFNILYYFYMLQLASLIGSVRGLFNLQKVTWRSS